MDWNPAEKKLQLGAGVLRAVRRRQVPQQRGRRLRVFPGPQRPRHLRHAVLVRVHGRQSSGATARNTRSTLKRADIKGKTDRGARQTAKRPARTSAGGRTSRSSRTSTSRSSTIPTRSSARPWSTRASPSGFSNEIAAGKFETTDFLYENGILDYVAEIAGEETLSHALLHRRPSARAVTARTSPSTRSSSRRRSASRTRSTPSSITTTQLLARARRRAGEGGEAAPSSTPSTPTSSSSRQVSEKREQDQLSGRGGLPRACDELLLHPDLL